MNIDFLLNLTPQDVVLTPNQRLANTLQTALEKHHLAQNNFAFTPPLLLSFSSFVRLLWKSYIFISPKKLLSNDEAAWLWKNILTQSDVTKNLLNTTQTAVIAQSAWDSLKQWRLTTASLESDFTNENVYFFNQWANDFTKTCDKNNFIDESSALEAYANNPFFIQSLPYQKFYFYHFLEMKPLEAYFIQTLKAQKKIVTLIQQPSINAECFRVELETFPDEILSMALWAKEKYTINNNSSIACVIPNLHQQRDEILRIFKQVFNTPTPPIDISAGYLLTDFSVVQHMLLLIDLLSPAFDYELFSTFLRSAYFYESENELSARNLLDIELRKICTKTTSLTKIFSIFDSRATAGSPYIRSLVFPTLHQTQTLQQWCEQWLELLMTLGWPGQRNLNSTEYQVTQRFINLLLEIEDFCTLQSSWSWFEFSSLLKTKCQQTVFQPKSEKTSIQLLGMLEASGMTFDYLWVMGLEDKTWPSAPSPNPLLPYSLQKKYGLPHASAEREYLFCKELLEKLINSSAVSIVSSAMYDQDKKLNPSPLIMQIPVGATGGRPDDSNATKNVYDDQYFIDNTAPPVLKTEKITGGTSIIQHQALCPFKAFAIHRLDAQEIPQPIDVPDALTRGNKIHRALELFWKEVKNSENLKNLSENQLDYYIKKSLDVTYHQDEKQNLFFTSLEKIRLNKLMHAWLDIEKQRSPFTVIAVEEKKEYQYKNIIIRMRVDRIDELEDGSHIIIDYKTGTPNIQHWFGERIKEPQLPIYYISHATAVSALFFVQLRWNDLCIKGVVEGESEHKTVIPFEKLSPDIRAPNWNDQKAQWKSNINHLLNDFIAGKADVNPLDQTTCHHCHLQSFCRIFEHIVQIVP